MDGGYERCCVHVHPIIFFQGCLLWVRTRPHNSPMLVIVHRNALARLKR